MSGNPIRGEIAFEVQGQAYCLILDFNALCILEEKHDVGVAEIVAQLQGNVRGVFLRSVFWAGLQQRHPDLTEMDAGVLISGLGVDGALTLVLEGFTAAFPKREAGKSTAGPQKRARKSPGISSTASPSGAES